VSNANVHIDTFFLTTHFYKEQLPVNKNLRQNCHISPSTNALSFYLFTANSNDIQKTSTVASIDARKLGVLNIAIIAAKHVHLQYPQVVSSSSNFQSERPFRQLMVNEE